MGTRNLTFVVHKKQIRIAQYGQWDGYPTGQGYTVAAFIQKYLSNPRELQKFRMRVDSCKFLSPEELDSIWKAKPPKMEMIKWRPEFSRDTAAGILEMVAKGEVTGLENETAFAGDSLMCEWAYLLDLDREILEIYKGFNEKPLGKMARFKGLPTQPRTSLGSTYYQIRLVRKVPFAKVNKAVMDALEERFSE